MTELKYRRILLKLSGEALAGPEGFGIDPTRAADIARRPGGARALSATGEATCTRGPAN